MDTFLRINGTDISLRVLSANLGLGDVKSIKLCQEIPAGTLTVSPDDCDTENYPGLDIALELPPDADTLPIMISRTEQEVSDEGSEPLRTFLYSRNESYIGYTDTDTRTDADFDEAPGTPVITASGDPGETVEVAAENDYVSYKGLL